MKSENTGNRNVVLFSLLAGLCPALAVTTTTANAIVLGIVVMFVMGTANLVFAITEDVFPERIRRLVKLVIVATLTALADVIVEFLTPGIWQSMGIYLPLTTVNCLVLEETGTGSDRRPEGMGNVDRSIVVGAAYMGTLVAIAVIREVLGAGTITLFPVASFNGTVSIPWLADHPVRFFVLPAGALVVAGYLKAAHNSIAGRTSGGRA